MLSVLTRRWRGLFVGFALAVAVLFGGGGAEGSASNGLIAALGAILLATILADQLTKARELPLAAALPLVAITAVLLLTVAQLVPLPANIWRQLPGRDIMAAALQQAGGSNQPRPLSIDAAATATWATALLMPSAILLHMARATTSERRCLFAILVGCAAVSALIGAMQLALGQSDVLSFYDGPSPGAASGLFANPNHQGLMMVLALLAVAGLAPSRTTSRDFPFATTLTWAAMAFFGLMAVASGSRAALALLAGAVPLAVLLRVSTGRYLQWVAIVGLAAALLWAVFLLYPGTNTLAIRESFSLSSDLRSAYYPDLLLTMKQYWPVGSGFGTFTTVFPPNENLDIATRAYLNHAHNDFLENLIEGGVAAAIAMAFALGSVAVVAAKRLIGSDDDRRFTAAAALMVLACCVHSLADYPLRTVSIGAAVALAAGAIFNSPTPVRLRNRSKANSAIYASILALFAIVGVGALRLNLIAAGLRDYRPDQAAALGSHEPLALAAQVESLLTAKAYGQAEALAKESVLHAPMNPLGLTLLARTVEAQGKPATHIWEVASLLGWREPTVQYWAFRHALETSQPEIAVLRADAILRTGEPPPQLILFLRTAANDAAFRAPIVRRLALNPGWRASFFAVTPHSSVQELTGVFAILAQEAAAGLSVSTDAAQLSTALISSENFDAAAHLYQLIHPAPKGRDLVFDPEFTEKATEHGRGTMFDWRLIQGRGISVDVDSSNSTRLVIDSTGDRTQPAAVLYFPVGQGNYELSYRVRGDQGQSALLRLKCLQPSRVLAQVGVIPTAAFRNDAVSVDVPESCVMAKMVVVSQAADAPGLLEFERISVLRGSSLRRI